MSDLLTPAELAAIAEREAKATKGPWKRDPYNFPNMQVIAHGNEVVSCHRAHNRQASERVVPNHEFIAHARTDIPALLRHIAALEARTPAPATDVDALLAEAEDEAPVAGSFRDLIQRLATALRESRAREVAAEKKYQRLFEPWDEVNGWCEHNHQFSYRLDDEDNSDGCMQCERDAAIARAEKAEAEAKEANSTLDMYAKAWWRELKGPYRNKRHEIDALVLTTRERISDLAAARAELGALGPVEGLNMPYGVIRVRRVLEGGAQ